MATGVIRQSNQRFENLFFAGMVVLFATIVFVGFARSYEAVKKPSEFHSCKKNSVP
jgi:hypothetical protein